MELVQFTGPFTAGQRLTAEPTIDYYYAQIGMQVPHRQPIAIPETTLSDDLKDTYIISDSWREEHLGMGVDFNINNKTYQRNLPPESIIDICFKQQGE